MKRRKSKPIKARKAWVINPKTRIKLSEKLYERPKAKRALRRMLNSEGKKTR